MPRPCASSSRGAGGSAPSPETSSSSTPGSAPCRRRAFRYVSSRLLTGIVPREVPGHRRPQDEEVEPQEVKELRRSVRSRLQTRRRVWPRHQGTGRVCPAVQQVLRHGPPRMSLRHSSFIDAPRPGRPLPPDGPPDPRGLQAGGLPHGQYPVPLLLQLWRPVGCLSAPQAHPGTLNAFC